AAMFKNRDTAVRLLDAGAGMGSLTQAFIENRCSAYPHPESIHVEAYEIDSSLLPHLQQTMERCRKRCLECGVVFTSDIHNQDFIKIGAELVRDDFFSSPQALFNATILNPPYRKISSDSAVRESLRFAGIETSNLYTGFLALAAKLLCRDGELVAITPRSFANGPYFRPFRELFLGLMSLRQLHVFDSRSAAFARDKVLQENIILHAVKSEKKPATIIVSKSSGAPNAPIAARECKYNEIISPTDPEMFIHLWTDDSQDKARQLVLKLRGKLADLGLEVSTGRVVDFRAKQALQMMPARTTVPLIYPCHFKDGYVAWPKMPSRKPNALALGKDTQALMVPSAIYVLTKRFSAKEERRRVVACIYDPTRISSKLVGFENHLNYFHHGGSGLSMEFARGLAAYLNSTVLDVYFRQFNGHTQVNATDLRQLPYPTSQKLEALGRVIGSAVLIQEELDKIVHEELLDD
ncbi:MAG: Eco57I restriction-modification methylase domain-containing protein, partial [Kiritimatiellaeota bacterium]|nr:Eco57I restriction-modification methylase domain-containing protein [Kiritimatiellota bacterium]